MDEDEYVETSDVEEREEYFWKTQNDEEMSPQARNIDDHGEGTLTRDEEGPPRKKIKASRIKLSYLNLEDNTIPHAENTSQDLINEEVYWPFHFQTPKPATDPAEAALWGIEAMHDMRNDKNPPLTRASPDPLLLDTQSDPVSPISSLKEEDMDSISENVFSPLREDSDLPPSTSRSPTRSPTYTEQSRSQSADPLSLFEATSPTMGTRSSEQPVELVYSPTSLKVMKAESPPLASFRSPFRVVTNTSAPASPLQFPFSSPLPRSLPTPSPPHPVEQSISIPPSPHSPAPSLSAVDTNPEPETAVPSDMEVVIPPDTAPPSRYTLRERRPLQKNPYTVEKFQYKQALSRNPEAIIRVRSPQRGRSHTDRPEDYEEDAEESQWQDEDYQHNHSPERDYNLHRREINDLMSGLPESGDDEPAEVRDLRMEARRLEKKRQKEQETENKRKRLHRAKPFPVTEKPRKRLRTRSPSAGPSPGPSRSAHEDHLFDFQQVVNDDEMDLPGPEPSRRRLSRTSSRRTIQIASDEEDPPQEDAEPPDEDLDEYSGLTVAQQKALGRMMPAIMIDKLADTSQPKPRSTRRRSSIHESGSDAEPAPLQPGQSRTRISKDPRGVREVKGDSESSSSSSSEDEAGGESGVIEIPSDDSSDDAWDDQKLESAFDGDIPEDEGHYDRMYERPRKLGYREPPSSRPKKKRRTGSGYKLDIVTGGARRYGDGRQTMLDFDRSFERDRSSDPPERSGSSHSGGHRKKKKLKQAVLEFDDLDGSGSRASSSRQGGGYRPREASAAPNQFGSVVDQDLTKKNRKEKKKRAEAKARGHYVFISNDTRFESRRRNDGMVTIDFEDTAPRSFARAAQNWTMPPSPASRLTKKGSAKRPFTVEDDYASDSDVPVNHSSQGTTTAAKTTDKTKEIWGRLGLNPLPPGFSFAATSSIKKQHLSELLAALSSERTPSMPNEITRRGVTINPSRGLQHVRQGITKIFNGLFELITGVTSVEDDEEHAEWQTLALGACQIVSAMQAQAESSTALELAVEEEVEIAIARCRKADTDFVSEGSVEGAALSYMWFAIELAARSKTSTPSTAFQTSIQCLVHALMVYGLENTMAVVNPEKSHVVEDDPVRQRTAELWVQLYYLVDKISAPSTSNDLHPFWSIIQVELASKKPSGAVDTSEAIWRTVFSLSTLMQFSKHGMVTSNTHGPACWQLVVTAFQALNLHLPKTSEQLIQDDSGRRDGYIALLILRCFYLWEQWHWSLADVSRTGLYDILGNIFRARNFAALRGESDKFPSFLTTGDWKLLDKHEPNDTAYCMFLKLVIQTVWSTDPRGPKGLLARSKKVLALVTPVGSLPYSKNSAADVDLSMYANRLSVIAATIYLDRTQIQSRISQAQNYVNFSQINGTVRVAVIDGMKRLGIILRNNRLPLEPIGSWIESIAMPLVDEYRVLKQSLPSNVKDTPEIQRVYYLLCRLVYSVKKVADGTRDDLDYPDSVLISSLSSILGNQGLTDTLNFADVVRQFLLSFIVLRRRFLPEPARPSLPSENQNQESQDEFGDMDFGLDFADIAFADFDGIPNYIEQEKALAKAIEKSNLHWTCWRQLLRLIKEGAEQRAAYPAGSFDSWLDCWLWCADILIRYGEKKTWPLFLNVLEKNGTQDISPIRRHRIELRLMSKLLKLNPMTYLDFKDRYFEALMICLAFINTQHKLEHEYVDFLLTIDGCRHPLLLGCPNDGDNQHALATAGFLKLRQDVLETVFSNLANLLVGETMTDNVQTHEDNQKYVGFLITMFKAMEARFSELGVESDERRTYTERCREVFQMLQKHQVLRSHSRLTFWVDWERSLS